MEKKGILCFQYEHHNNSPPPPHPPTHPPPPKKKNLDTSVLHMLARREIAPRTGKWFPKKRWGEVSSHKHRSCVRPESERVRNSRTELLSWVEAESLRCLSAKYCPLVPSPRSTIAAAFSADGKTLASTHGDHTVKIIDCQTGKCEKVLSGHRRTPWVVRFHPLRPEILASGSLDHEVRLWNANTSECIGSRDFYRPIASIAFHAEGELLAVAAGHKLYLWHYNNNGEATSPSIVLRTRRSLRAVHFHPHSAPFLLTAEVNDLDSSDSPMAPATSLGYLHYRPPAVYMGNMHSIDRLSLAAELPLMPVPLLCPPYPNNDSRPQLQIGSRPVDSVNGQLETPDRLQVLANATELYEQMMASAVPLSTTPDNTVVDNLSNPTDVNGVTNMDTSGADGIPEPMPSTMRGPTDETRQTLFTDRVCWELPFMQGWLVGQSQAGTSLTTLPPELAEGSLAMPYGSSNGASTSTSQYRQNSMVNETNGGNDSFPIISRIQSQLSASLTATAAAELPCTVKLRIWPHDFKNPCATLKSERCRLVIPHAVLCSEMGAHFSPCGRYLAACVACVLPQFEADPGLPTHLHQERASTSPTRHPISARQVMYELRIYSLEEATFGLVLISRPIRAAHCLTSIQFSPTSEHILLAYGRRHSSLLKSIVINGETSSSIYTVLEVYRVSDMELVSVLPSAEDEVNVACFHPLAGGGLVYGTKEGKLRILQYDGAHATRSDQVSEAQAVELNKYVTGSGICFRSEMGAHFSPCGRYLAACVACVLPQFEADPGLPTHLHQERASTSPTRHPISARQVMYELRIYSLEEATFGLVLISRPIRAAHCLTSIQFSPTSEHILLAYGRRHSSLLKSIVINGETSSSIYTVLEVYRVSDMELVSVLPSAEDEVNVACFHPLAGGGLVYGTKEGKLRILQYDGAHATRSDQVSEAQAVEVEP
ncbi:hypothetical protein SSX86_013126 [Deinandra increscens subsp. villosa]|uniref:Transducin family protein / WD-40 repeat family protein n=1 Tax=Deinandra increscens subsp. villosa TaxID=3103831 RepID=A0AAP0D5G7_9ASTR